MKALNMMLFGMLAALILLMAVTPAQGATTKYCGEDLQPGPIHPFPYVDHDCYVCDAYHRCTFCHVWLDFEGVYSGKTCPQI